MGTGLWDIATAEHLLVTYRVGRGGYPEEGRTYTRNNNPTREILRERLPGVTSAEQVLAAASGMSTVSTIPPVLCPGDGVLAIDSLYSRTTNLFDEFATVLCEMLEAPLSPFASYLVLRGLKTLPARMASW